MIKRKHDKEQPWVKLPAGGDTGFAFVATIPHFHSAIAFGAAARFSLEPAATSRAFVLNSDHIV